MRHWWLLVLGIAIAGVAILSLVRGGPTALPIAAGPPPLDEIDEASRAKLERVLRAAEAAEAGGERPR